MSASTVRPLADTSAKPPSTTIFVFAAAGIHRQDARPQGRDQRRMAGQHAEVAFGAGHVDLVDLAREHELFRRDQFEVKCGHNVLPCLTYAASAASFLPFSTASSMLPTM